MAMSRLPASLVQKLDDGAFEMSEIFASRGHNIDHAVSLDRAFRRTRRSRSALTLDLMGDAFYAAMSKVGLDPRRANGGAMEVLEHIPGGYANIRLRRAERKGDGFFVRANTASSFGYVDEMLLEPDYPYVFGFAFDAEDQLQMFVAEVTKVIEGNPGELVLDTPLLLGGSGTPAPRPFEPDADSWLPGLDDEQEDAQSA